MNWPAILRVTATAALGALGMVGLQNTVPAVKQATAPQIVQIKPDCPAIYLDNVKIERRK